MLYVKYTYHLKKFLHTSVETEKQSFENFNELTNWIFSQMQQDYHYHMFFPKSDFWASISSCLWFKPTKKETIHIHVIENENGIIFSDGVFTSGHCFWSKSAKKWCLACSELTNLTEPNYHFVDD